MTQYEPKNKHRSIRITTTVNKWIEAQPGYGFNDKLHNMVYHFMAEELDLNERIGIAKNRLNRLERRLSALESFVIIAEDMQDELLKMRLSVTNAALEIEAKL